MVDFQFCRYQVELGNPMNVHRWRKLEGTDPVTIQYLKKVKGLQKRLIMKTEEVLERDALIAEKEKLYVHLKGILARQPGPDVAEQLALSAFRLERNNSNVLVGLANARLGPFQSIVALEVCGQP